MSRKQIATIEEKYLNTKYFSISLSCVSKKKILEAYYETLEDFIVIVGGFVQYYSIIKHGEDYLKNNYLLFKEKSLCIFYASILTFILE